VDREVFEEYGVYISSIIVKKDFGVPNPVFFSKFPENTFTDTNRYSKWAKMVRDVHNKFSVRIENKENKENPEINQPAQHFQ